MKIRIGLKKNMNGRSEVKQNFWIRREVREQRRKKYQSKNKYYWTEG